MTITRFQYPADTVKECPARGEILVPLGAVGFVLMGTLLVSTLLSLQAIQTVLPWMAATGIVLLAAGAVIHIRRVAIKFRLGFIALFCLTVAVGLWLAAGERGARVVTSRRPGNRGAWLTIRWLMGPGT